MSPVDPADVRELPPAPDHPLRRWVAERTEQTWGGPTVVTRGRVHVPVELPGLVAYLGDEPAGLLTYRPELPHWEVVTLEALQPRCGVATALLEAVAAAARQAGAASLWLVTTNDNLDALRLYQRRGYHLHALHPGALAASRRLKPGIPQVGEHGIPLRDEIELRLELSALS